MRNDVKLVRGLAVAAVTVFMIGGAAFAAEGLARPDRGSAPAVLSPNTETAEPTESAEPTQTAAPTETPQPRETAEPTGTAEPTDDHGHDGATPRATDDHSG